MKFATASVATGCILIYGVLTMQPWIIGATMVLASVLALGSMS